MSLALTLVVLAASASLAQSSSPGASAAPLDPAAARAWCEAKGGQAEVRDAYYGTNDDQSTWVDLGRTMEVCRFEADDESRIYVDTWTLATPTPTLASVAYLAKVQNELDPAKGNPATQNCAALGGSSSFGTGAAGGGWVNLDDPTFQVIAMCVFPDGSAIDDWGITYYSGDVVRGADLAPLFGWTDQDPLPPFFG
jgi:putative hemolysin